VLDKRKQLRPKDIELRTTGSQNPLKMDNDFSSLTTPYDSEYDSMNNLSFFYNETGGPSSGEGYSYLEQTILAVVAGILSLLTIFGNVLVMVSFKLDKQLQTISNYFLLSLAGKSS